MKARKVILSLITISALGLAFPSQREQAQSGRARDLQLQPAAADGHNFVIARSADGINCRQADARETAALHINERRTELRVLGDTTERRTSAQNFRITLRGTPQLDGFPTARAAFLRAAERWQSIIQSQVTVIIDVDFGTTRFGTPYPSPNIIGSTGTQSLFSTDQQFYGFMREALLDTAVNAQQQAVFNALPQPTLPTDLGATRFGGGTSAQLRALEFLDPIANPQAEAPLGAPPSIGFNSAIPFDFDPSDGIDAGSIDFEAVALHEIGHALGFISNVGLKENNVAAPIFPSVWDLFRFRPNLNFDAIGNRPRVQLTGGEQVYFVGGAEFRLSTAASSGQGGDGNQSSHWKDDLQNGGQVIGIMDPTGSNGERDFVSAADLIALSHMGYRINPDSQVAELITFDDTTPEEALSRPNAIVVNRFTPQRYPARLRSVRLRVPVPAGGPSPVGASLRVLAFADANRTGQPPANPAILAERTISIPALPGNRVIEVDFPNGGPTIIGGDLYVGFQTADDRQLLAGDTNGPPRGRSFISTNNGAAFQPFTVTSGPTPVPLNFLARAIFSGRFGDAAAPTLAALSPSAAAPGGAQFFLFVQGANFQGNSTVRWNGADRPTTFISGSTLRAAIPTPDIANAGTARVTVATGGNESTPLTFTISTENPAPSLARLEPPALPTGSAALTVNVFGTNFTANSVVRVNGNNRPTNLVNSLQLTAMLTAGDVANAGTNSITVGTPAPGGGVSNQLSLNVIQCSYDLSLSGPLRGSSLAGGGGFILNTNAACPWTVSSDVPWITFSGPPNNAATGRSVISFDVAENTGVTLRGGTITAGGQTLRLDQVGRAASVSAASFVAPPSPLTANMIAAAFGNGLANTAVTVTDSRNITRNAQTFFTAGTQVNYLVPGATAAGAARVIFRLDGLLVADGPATIAAIAPGLFAANAAGQGVAAAVILRRNAANVDTFEPVAVFDQGQSRFVARPITFGAETDRLFLILFGTGIRGRTAVSAVTVRVGDTAVPVLSADPQGELLGLDQINVGELPRSLAGRGQVNVNLTVDGRAANVVTVTFQ